MKATLDSLNTYNEQLYVFEVIAPDGVTSFEFEFRGITTADIWQVERDFPAPKAPEVFQKIDGKDKPVLVPNYADPGYIQARETHAKNRMNALVLKGWTEAVPGKDYAEQCAYLEALPNWVISGLWKCINYLTVTEDDAVRPRNFHGAGMASDDVLPPDALES
jgi:hypothetical protein